MCLTCAALVLPGASEARESNAAALPPAVADHHLHIQSPAITEELRRRAELAPEQFAIFNQELLETRTGHDALRVLDATGIRDGALLSMGYMFASPRATVDRTDAPALTRAENEWNVKAASMSGGRLRAFISVNPFSDFALDEIAYWGGRPYVTGLKLHLGNSSFDWRSDVKVAQLASAFDLARTQKMPVIVHVRAGGTYDQQETRRFIDEVISRSADNVVQIAHGGGEGGLDEATIQALTMYADAIDRGAPGTKNMMFDLAAVLVRDTSDPTAVALLKRFAQLVRKIGLHRFLMASDWPSVLEPGPHNDMLADQIPLTHEEWLLILNNRASYFEK